MVLGTATASAAVVGAAHVALLRDHPRRLRRADDHPNRSLHYDEALAALPAGFRDPAVRGLRTLDDPSRGEAFARDAGLPGVERVCRSTPSDAPAAQRVG